MPDLILLLIYNKDIELEEYGREKSSIPGRTIYKYYVGFYTTFAPVASFTQNYVMGIWLNLGHPSMNDATNIHKDEERLHWIGLEHAVVRYTIESSSPKNYDTKKLFQFLMDILQ